MIDVSTQTNNGWRPYTKDAETSTLTLQRSIRKRTTKSIGCQSVNQIDLLSPIRSIAAPILNSTLSRKSSKSKVRTSQNLKTFRAKIIGDASPLKPISVSGKSSGISCLELVDDVDSNHVNNRIVNSEIENNSVNNDVVNTDTVSDGVMVKSKVDNFDCGSDHSFLNTSTETFVDDEVNDPSFDPVEWEDVSDDDDTEEETHDMNQEDRILLVCEKQLRKLLQHCPRCGSDVLPDETCTFENQGSQFRIQLVCAKNCRFEWTSQPESGCVKGLTNLTLTAAILFSGIPYRKFELLAWLLNLKFISEQTYYRLRRQFVAPVVRRAWKKEQEMVRINKFLSTGMRKIRTV